MKTCVDLMPRIQKSPKKRKLESLVIHCRGWRFFVWPLQLGTKARQRRRRALVRAAFFAAAERLAAPFVFAAFRAAADRAAAVRREAARRVCRESDGREAVLRGSRLRTRDTARETRGRRRVLRLPWPAS